MKAILILRRASTPRSSRGRLHTYNLSWEDGIMGLVSCAECGGEVSPEALDCPHCGGRASPMYCLACGKKAKLRELNPNHIHETCSKSLASQNGTFKCPMCGLSNLYADHQKTGRSACRGCGHPICFTKCAMCTETVLQIGSSEVSHFHPTCEEKRQLRQEFERVAWAQRWREMGRCEKCGCSPTQETGAFGRRKYRCPRCENSWR